MYIIDNERTIRNKKLTPCGTGFLTIHRDRVNRRYRNARCTACEHHVSDFADNTGTVARKLFAILSVISSYLRNLRLSGAIQGPSPNNRHFLNRSYQFFNLLSS